MSYTDEEEPLPPTRLERAAEIVYDERDFIIDTLLLVIVAIALSTAYGIWAWVGFGSLMLHTILTYRGK